MIISLIFLALAMWLSSDFVTYLKPLSERNSTEYHASFHLVRFSTRFPSVTNPFHVLAGVTTWVVSGAVRAGRYPPGEALGR